MGGGDVISAARAHCAAEESEDECDSVSAEAIKTPRLSVRSYARATRATVSQVRVVSSFPNVRSISVMNTGPLGLGT